MWESGKGTSPFLPYTGDWMSFLPVHDQPIWTGQDMIIYYDNLSQL